MRKMIIRIDDTGYTDFCNMGTFQVFEHGLGTSADVMLDSPGTEDALRRLKEFPWISIGWHTHMWGAPVAGAENVPSLVEHGGEFDGRFRKDLFNAEDVVYEEAVKELRTQLDRCLDILGKVPDVTGERNGSSVWDRAFMQVVEEYGIVHSFASKEAMDQRVVDKVIAARARGEKWADYYPDYQRPGAVASPKWADRKIQILDGSFAYIDLYTDSIASVEENYDPVKYYTEDRAHILDYPEDVIIQQAWHPGFVDYYVYRLGERDKRPRAQQVVIGRTQDAAALCSKELHDWIKENKIELVNTRDALYGTREYQNHLRRIGSDLAV